MLRTNCVYFWAHYKGFESEEENGCEAHNWVCFLSCPKDCEHYRCRGKCKGCPDTGCENNR